MNVKYVNIDGQVVVMDEKGNIVSPQDRADFEEILAVKNSVEKIKREMDVIKSYPKQEEVLLIKPKEVPKKNFFMTFLKTFLKVVILTLIVNGVMLSWIHLMALDPFGFASMQTFGMLSILEILTLALPMGGIDSHNAKLDYYREVNKYQQEEETYQKELEKAKGREKRFALLSEELKKEEEHLNQLVSKWDEKRSLGAKLATDKEQLEELKRLIQDIHIFEYNSNNEKEAPKVYKK